jgi:hypothetical protein
MTDGYNKHECIAELRVHSTIRCCDALIEGSPSSAHFLLYQEDDNVLGDSEDLRGTALHYTATRNGSRLLQRR